MSNAFLEAIIEPKKTPEMLIQPLLNTLSRLGLSESEQFIILRVTKYSLALCLVAVVGFWAATFFTHKTTNVPLSSSGSQQNLSLNTLDLKAHRYIANSLMQKGQPEKAINHFHRLLETDSEEFGIRKNLANAYLNAGHFEEALSALKQLLKEDTPDSLHAVLQAQKGITLFYLGEHNRSLNALRSSLDIAPNTPEALCFMGQIEASRSIPSPQAEKLLKRSIEVDSQYVEGWYQLARYYTQTGEYLEARKLLLEALHINPLHERSHSRLGMVYYYLNKADASLRSYKTALALNPDDFNTRYNLGKLYYTLIGDTHKALHQFNRALEKYPYHPEANFKSGLICLKNGMVKEAIRFFTNSLKQTPGDVRKLLQLANAYERLGNRDEALRVYRKITDIDPLNSIAFRKIRSLSD
ncbi:tetratricopeptide repeat protein [Chitinispirillales bacterium ANBcel5]|uniref:tetratricopeptide repeat protein n=1 Tax=Cellulosispirillum alkaliphilum TaxID=3039283 RepID=UPI002A4EE1C7|nr:tetratricopeptide repeat protein [Chitinispirillales bacterium ANBcel5]